MAGSSQCASSTTHSTSCSSAAAVNTVKVATPIRNGSTAGPSSSPNAIRSARACGGGSWDRSRVSGRSSRCSAAYAQRRLDLEATRPQNGRRRSQTHELVQESGLADPRLAAHHDAAGRPVPRRLDRLGEECQLPLAAHDHAATVPRRRASAGPADNPAL